MQNVMILTGDGLNCEEETEAAFRLCGAKTEIVHILDLLQGRKSLRQFQLLAFIGGFSSGDHLGSGTVLANRFQSKLKEPLLEFVEDNKKIIGICNGFQALVRLGLLPHVKWGERSTSLSFNDSKKFEDRWVHLKANTSSPCVWTKGIDTIYLPVRHKEGKFLCDETFPEEQIVLRYSDPETLNPTQAYPYNPNGSRDAIAGICDPSGRIFGLMPHPEAFLHRYQHPQWMRKEVSEEGEGMKIFRSIVS